MKDKYQPIENYGLIGDMHSLALVGRDGSIDWMCAPYFDSSSIFAKILDSEIGGSFFVKPLFGEVARKQLYLPETNVLTTRFFCEHGVGEITDFMPIYEKPLLKTRIIIRQVRAVRGSVKFIMGCRPAFDFARKDHETKLSPEGIQFTSDAHQVFLSSPLPLTENNNGAEIEFELSRGQQCTFVLKVIEGELRCDPWMFEEEADQCFNKTVRFWRNWISKSTYRGRWREMVDRSAFALKLLTFQPTGAIIAAGTTSLPEEISGVRNWDYRYTWVRDAAFTVYAFIRIGFVEEANHFMKWMEERCKELGTNDTLQIMYGIDGRHELTEECLDHLDGYMGSRPVRIGNAAYSQKQLDIYGELLDAIYLCNKYGTPISYEFWTYIVRLVDWVCENWNTKDEGVWEVRGEPQHFVYSKLMCWVAIDRALRLADKRSFPGNKEYWEKVRDEIFNEIMAKGWSTDKQAFVQYFGSSNLDAANLMMPLTFFVSPTDPRMLRTLDAILKDPSEGGLVANSLVYRYNVDETCDGLPGHEGTFNICTFWLVEALTRAAQENSRYLDEARMIFEKMLGFANHLGLYAEQIGDHGEALGNYPQAFTHIALISAAFNLNTSLSKPRGWRE
ncbi:MAG TPA: glycoside hydrolase family 15 protein [Oligoflexia bacterium]|nr:glycoside hydrolase family 15 protein [Oligoflexia bacterium]HMP47851.1 glycoside hydrolase family 15 protein [Oligoflexia bacterium]